MKKIVIVIFAVFASCLLISMAKSDNGSSRAVAVVASSEIDTLKATGDTLIETTLYEFVEESEMTQIVDSILKFDTFGSMALSYSNKIANDTAQYIQQKFRLLNKDDLKHLRGVYYNECSEKPLFIVNVEDSDIVNMGLTNTGRRVVVPCQTARENAVQAENFGYSAYFGIWDDAKYEYALFYNNRSISDEPDAGDKFKWLNPSWSKDSIMKRKDYISRKSYINSLYEAKAKGESQDFKITDNCDTIFAYTSNLGSNIFERTYTVPIYEFDDSYNGQIIKRLCDSISENDLFVQHGITGKRIQTDSLSTIVITDANIQDFIERNELGGVILNYNKKSPISVENLPQEFLAKFGIVKTNRTVTVVHTNPWNLLWIDANGLIAWVKIMPEGYLKVNLQFGNQYPNKDLAEPFMWLIDQ